MKTLQQEIQELIARHEVNFCETTIRTCNILSCGAATFLESGDTITSSTVREWAKETDAESAEFFDLDEDEFESMLWWVDNNSDVVAQYFNRDRTIDALKELV